MRTLYLIGGPMGVGKTTVCQIMKRRLPRAAFLDGDWCWDMHPFRVTEETKELVLGNIALLLNRFLRCSACDHVILAWVLHRQEVLDALLEQVDTAGCAVRPISLVCQPEVLRARIGADIAAGRRDAGAAERALAYLPLYRELHTEHIDTSELTPEQAARRILERSQRT